MNIREYLDSYNISEECKQSILELFDRPSLGRTMWDLGGGSKLTKAVKGKIEDWKNKSDREEASKAYDAAHKAHQETQDKYNKGEATPSEVAKTSGDFENAKARFNKAHGYSSHTVPGTPKKEEEKSSAPQEPTKREKIRDYLNKQGEYNTHKSKIDNARHNYNYKYYDYKAVKDSEYATPSEVAEYQNKASQAKSKLINTVNGAQASKSAVSKARKELFPKSPVNNWKLRKPVAGKGKLKEIKESFDILDSSLSDLGSLFEEIGTAISGMMDAQPINLAGKEQPSAHKQKKAQYNYKYRKLHRKNV